MQREMKITVCPPGYAHGYDQSASVVNGFFIPRGISIYSHRANAKFGGRISADSISKYGAAQSLAGIIDINKGKF